MSLRRALVLLIVLVLTAGLVPAGLLLERRLGNALLERTRDDLARAPVVLDDRLSSVRTVRMMHARDFAAMPALADALTASDHDAAGRMVSEAARAVQEEPVLVGADGEALIGPGPLPPQLVDATRQGEMPVAVMPISEGLHLIALAPVMVDGAWMGAVGGSTPFADAEAGRLAGLTRADVVVVDGNGGITGTTVDSAYAAAMAANATHGSDPATGPAARAAAADDADDERAPVRRVEVGDRVVLAVGAPLDHGQVVFFRDLETELAVLPALRRTALVSGGSALVLALLVGTLFASRLSRPVSELADAAEGFASGHPDTPLRPSSITEVRRMSEAFAAMRSTLAARLRELEDRQERLSVLQAELVQRERLAASGRLLAQLAHEIRNPVASVRNCLEVVRRKGDLSGEPAEFADMAVDELLRMHELAERMLDLHRPRDPGDRTCSAAGVARETAQLASAGAPPGTAGVSVVGQDRLRAAMAPDALKQVLLNLVLNAREVSPADTPVEIVLSRRGGRVRLEVLDRGPGIPTVALPRLFDPFFTTKRDVQGVGLGLYTAEGLVRAAGGTLTASNREDGPGARFVVDLPLADEVPALAAGTTPATGQTAGTAAGAP